MKNSSKSYFRSKTVFFNLVLIVGGMFAPGLTYEVRNILITNGVIGLGLRAKTDRPLRF